MGYSIFDAFKCNEDLFYTIYDYLRFVKPEKWNFIHSTDDFNFMLADELFTDYVVRQGSVEPLFTQFCNGTTVQCEGLSQWGTVDLAEMGDRKSVV